MEFKIRHFAALIIVNTTITTCNHMKLGNLAKFIHCFTGDCDDHVVLAVEHEFLNIFA